MADLSEYVPALLREIQPPGADLFPGVVPADWVGYLADAFWEARLDGFGIGYSTVENAPGDIELVGVDGRGEPPRELIALVILYAGIRVLRNRILNTNTSFRAKSGPSEFERQNSATVLAEMLKQLKETKERLIHAIEYGATDVLVVDAFSTRLHDAVAYHGGPELMG